LIAALQLALNLSALAEHGRPQSTLKKPVMTQQKRQFLNFSFVQVRRTHPLGLPRLRGLSTASETYSIGASPLPQALLTLAFRLTRSPITYHTSPLSTH